MAQLVFASDPQVTLPIHGTDARFPVQRVFCLGRNYFWEGADRSARCWPLYFMKPSSAVVEAAGSIPYPPMTDEFCHEVELVVALGKGGRTIPRELALECVWGYAVGLDLTRRDMQQVAKAAGQPWEAAKAFDAAAPVGPLVAVETGGHHAKGGIWLSVNGKERQRSDLAEQMWSVPEIISQLSEYIELRAGDLIMTGTPQGVDTLEPGDDLAAGIDGLGSIRVHIGARATPFSDSE